MTNWLILVGHQDMVSFETLTALCTSRLAGTSHQHSEVQRLDGYNLVVVCADGPVSVENYEALFASLGVRGGEDRVVVFCHGGRDYFGSGGSPSEVADAFMGSFPGFLFRSFRATEERKDSNYPYWYTIQAHVWLAQGQNEAQGLSRWEGAPQWDEIASAAAPKPARPLSVLKHDIAHFFAPLDLDLQHAATLPAAQQPAYIADALKGGDYYRRRLADLWWVVVRGRVDGKTWLVESEPCARPESSELPGRLLEPSRGRDALLRGAEDRSVVELIDDDARQDSVVRSVWPSLLAFCGLTSSDSGPFDTRAIRPSCREFGDKADAPIFEFVCLLDGLFGTSKGTGVTKTSVTRLLSHFANLESGDGWRVTRHDTPIRSLHDWALAVDDCLGTIRDHAKG